MTSLRWCAALFIVAGLRLIAQPVDLATEPVHAMVDEPPVFPGGETALRNHLLVNMVLPDSVFQQGLFGTLKVRFVVDRTGEVRDAEVVFPLHPSVDAEAIRVMNDLPLWKPGRLRGKPVNVMYVLPIRFGKG